MYRGNKNVRISDQELALLGIINHLGPCTSQKVHETFDMNAEYLHVMRCLHRLVEKGFLKRIIINQKQLYRTSRNYDYIKTLLKDNQ